MAFPLSDLERGPLPAGTPPSENEVRGMGVFGLEMGRSSRVALMNDIGTTLLIPAGGFDGQSRLFVKGDLRLVGLLALMTRESAAKSIAANLLRAGKNTSTNVLLTLVTASREHASALTATSDRLIDSWDEGGLDFLWKTKDQLGLPKSITGKWSPVPKFKSPETHNWVYPAYIPARDQTVVYGAQIAASFQRSFKPHLRKELGSDPDVALAGSSRIAQLIWQAYAFLAPGGRPYDPKRPVRAQLGQTFGSQAALSYVVSSARGTDSAAPVNLSKIFQDPALNHTEWVRSAKTRVAETLFLERLLTTLRELKMGDEA